MKRQGTAITSTVHPQKSLSLVHMCQLCAYTMRNMTIRYQFDGVPDYFEYVFFWNSYSQNSNARNCHEWYDITESWYQNPRDAITMHIGNII
jgi:hypothetical protein